jgi:hypothetical protein
MQTNTNTWMREPGTKGFNYPAFLRKKNIFINVRDAAQVIPEFAGNNMSSDDFPDRMGHDLDKDDLNPNS